MAKLLLALPFLLLCLPLRADSPFADPAVQFIESRDYYHIQANSWAQLRAALLRRPGKGEHAWAQTHWDAHYRLNFAYGTDHCRLVGMEVKLKLVITLPLWDNPPQALKNRWHLYSDHILRHELSHRQNVIEMVKRLRRKVLALPEAADCDRLKAGYQRIRAAEDARRDQDDRILDRQDRLWQEAEQRHRR
ncbi:DUF922 domain-containing protein [Gallaecimonas kandeliae]|uniref:DUF922 domain-containing protein n=1 Tax=Gallaecimonas kandeliae TaxID=3029055 RepID=UPI0026492333|nr:DUF922 domain-containing protein [Gallaecimonas kandeliae]WKE66190.1 DUF922 domain-containing protein [Gallaecimonas kandeliae]